MEEDEDFYEGVSPETISMLYAISDPKNAHLFTAEAARKAFAHVKIDEDFESLDEPLDN